MACQLHLIHAPSASERRTRLSGPTASSTGAGLPSLARIRLATPLKDREPAPSISILANCIAAPVLLNTILHQPCQSPRCVSTLPSATLYLTAPPNQHAASYRNGCFHTSYKLTDITCGGRLEDYVAARPGWSKSNNRKATRTREATRNTPARLSGGSSPPGVRRIYGNDIVSQSSGSEAKTRHGQLRIHLHVYNLGLFESDGRGVRGESVAVVRRLFGSRARSRSAGRDVAETCTGPSCSRASPSLPPSCTRLSAPLLLSGTFNQRSADPCLSGPQRGSNPSPPTPGLRDEPRINLSLNGGGLVCSRRRVVRRTFGGTGTIYAGRGGKERFARSPCSPARIYAMKIEHGLPTFSTEGSVNAHARGTRSPR
ncbi:hypothetical protein P4O66_022305 [Electrophorus voltai]|uniref:Uncharacterized protein n=1 Tax=Electrophorus voltai TaxID=2609070 RepID=A0AAD9E286_9TELE|nr:hypothetical protein P4O66_022305 [Electrophorus voltai]